MNKKAAAAAAAVIAMMLGGCGLITSADSLMSPPRLTEEQNDIYHALIKDTGSGINLVYPRTGRHRSAYMTEDLDSDGRGEAVVFYRRSDSADSDDTVRLNVFRKNDKGKWNSVYDHAGAGVSVNSADVSAVGKSSGKYLIVGYGLLSAGERTLQVYSYSDGILNTEFSGNYVEYRLAGLTEPDRTDLAVIQGSADRDRTALSLISSSGDGIEITGTIPLSCDPLSIEAVTAGRIAADKNAVFIDETTAEGKNVTEIIYCVDGKLRNPAAVEGSGILSDTARPKGYLCTDIDGDGIIEIPTAEPLPGYENEQEQLMLTRWNVFTNYEITEKYSGWYSRSEGWCFMFPGRWKGLVTARRDSATGAVIFCRYDSSVASSPELMRIAAVNNSDTELMASMGYTVMGSAGETDYLVRMPENSRESLILTSTELKNNFMIIDR